MQGWQKANKKLRAVGNGVTETGILNCNSIPEEVCVICHQSYGENGQLRLGGEIGHSFPDLQNCFESRD